MTVLRDPNAGWTGPRCRSCGAPLRWEKSPKTGRPVPISLATGENHFLDCPSANEHRVARPPKRMGKEAP
jgi:hypothetical protein